MAGNPNFVKKSAPAAVLTKRTRKTFELFPINSSAIPTDGKTGEKRSPYPAIKGVANGGHAINPESGLLEEWRYIHSFQKSIWVKDQPDELSLSQINDSRNDLHFKKGLLHVDSTEPAKLAALEVQDAFAGCKNKYNIGHPAVYFLIDQEEHNKKVQEGLDSAFEAEKAAREMTEEKMLSIASLYGIDTEQSSHSIRTLLVLKSKENPSAFMRSLLDPKVEVRFNFLKALQAGVINTTIIQGHVSWETGAVICKIDTGRDAVDELTAQWSNGDEKVKEAANRIKDMVTAE